MSAGPHRVTGRPLGQPGLEVTVDKNSTKARELTDEEFQAADDAIGAELRKAKLGTPERAAVDTRFAKWEAALKLPDITWQQRKDKKATIAAVAIELGLAR